ncbi:MAG: DUF1428 domain-containing protein [Paracoccaceae bacterium]
MPYVDGFVTAVPDGNRDKYLDFTRRAWTLFRDLGAIDTWENWGDDVPDGKLTDFRRAVQAQPGETVVFSWITWPDKTIRDKAMEKMMNAETAARLGQMPFDGKRMIYGGFDTIFSTGGRS